MRSRFAPVDRVDNVWTSQKMAHNHLILLRSGILPQSVWAGCPFLPHSLGRVLNDFNNFCAGTRDAILLDMTQGKL